MVVVCAQDQIVIVTKMANASGGCNIMTYDAQLSGVLYRFSKPEGWVRFQHSPTVLLINSNRGDLPHGPVGDGFANCRPVLDT